MFERDKDELRDLGIPLVTEPLDAYFDDELGLPDRRARVRPAGDHASSRTSWPCWAWPAGRGPQASLAGPAAQALRKLHAAGVERDDASLIGIEPRLRTAEPAFEPVKTAVRQPPSDPLHLPHRPLGRGRRAARPAVGDRLLARPLVPHRLRHATAARARVFRLSRIEGAVRPGRQGRVVRRAARPRATRDDQPRWCPSVTCEPSVLRVRPAPGTPCAGAPHGRPTIDDDWSLLDVDFADTEALADEIAASAPTCWSSSRWSCARPSSAGSRAPWPPTRRRPGERRRSGPAPSRRPSGCPGC